MERLRKFLYLPLAEQWSLFKIFFLLVVTHTALRLFPFKSVYRRIERAGIPKEGKNLRREASWICKAIDRTGSVILGVDSCFSQALVGVMLLKQNGYPADLHVGVLKNGDGGLRAHAWVEMNGAVVIGGPDSLVEKYTPLPDLDNIIP